MQSVANLTKIRLVDRLELESEEKFRHDPFQLLANEKPGNQLWSLDAQRKSDGRLLSVLTEFRQKCP